MAFAVFDQSPLTVYINCHILTSVVGTADDTVYVFHQRVPEIHTVNRNLDSI